MIRIQGTLPPEASKLLAQWLTDQDGAGVDFVRLEFLSEIEQKLVELYKRMGEPLSSVRIGGDPLADDELELKILQRFVEQHEAGGTSAPGDKSAQELDMREVIRELTGKEGAALDYEARRWFQRLVVRPSAGLSAAPLRPGKSGEPYRARAFMSGTAAFAWDRIRELQRAIAADHASRPGQVTNININDSTVANLNLGTVVGNMQATVGILHQTAPELATALAKFVEAVGADESLGDHRREIIATMNEVADEARKPNATRNTGRVRILLMGVGHWLLTHGANAAQIWETWGKRILRLFGLPDQ